MAKLPPLNALKCFEAAARSASFSRAAEELHVTQSAVSHQIRQLEQWFGVTLFDRQGRQTVPTARGEELARALAEAFDMIGSACRRIAQPDSAPALTIAALPSVATIWLIPRLSHFFRANPDISVKVIYAFHNQRIDFDEVRELARTHRPKMIVAGTTSYTRRLDPEPFKAIADGQFDHVPEQAFFLCGGIDDLERNAKKLAG